MHELVWSSRIRFFTSYIVMVNNDSSFIKRYIHMNYELIKILHDNKNEVEPVKFLILSSAR